MKKESYINMELLSLNCAGWGWTLTNEKWETRLNKLCDYLITNINDNTLIVALQEVQLGGGKYLSVFEKKFPDYHIVLPYGYHNQKRSVISMLLINKKLTKEVSITTLDDELEDSLRYNYVTVETEVEGLCFRVLNVNIPHTSYDNSADWYKNERIALRNKYLEEIKRLSNVYAREPDLKFICLGDFNTLPVEGDFIDSLAYSYDRTMIDAVLPAEKNIITWHNLNTNAKNRLDYILYSVGMLTNTGVKAKFTTVDYYPIHNKFSDHALLIGGVNIKLPENNNCLFAYPPYHCGKQGA